MASSFNGTIKCNQMHADTNIRRVKPDKSERMFIPDMQQ